MGSVYLVTRVIQIVCVCGSQNTENYVWFESSVSDCEDFCLLEYNASCRVTEAVLLLGLLFNPEGGSYMFLRIVACVSQDCTALCPRR